MRFKLFIILHIFLFVDGFAQLLNTKPSDISVADYNFNPEVVWLNKIKRIDVVISDKPDGSLIENKGAGIVYRFNEKGYLTRYTYTVLNRKEIVDNPDSPKKKGNNKSKETTTNSIKYVHDTVNVYVFYDAYNHIISKRVKTGNYFHSYYYEYDVKGQLRKAYHCHETNISGNNHEFKLGEQKTLGSDVFEYIRMSKTQIKKQTLNDQLNVYKKTIINYDSKNNKTSENTELTVSCQRQENNFEYDAKNRLVKHIFYSNENGELKTESVFEYDNYNNLLSEKKLLNNKPLFETYFIYDQETKLIKSEVNRDYKNATVIIKKYFYEFWE